MDYNYDITAFPNEEVHLSALQEEIIAGNLASAAISSINRVGDTVTIVFGNELSAEDNATLLGIVNAHQGIDNISTPPSSVVNYDEWTDPTTGTKYTYDPVREKWLSVARKCWVFSYMNNIKGGVYLSLGDLPNAYFGYYVPMDAVITGVLCRGLGNDTKAFEIRDGNNDNATLFSFAFDEGTTYLNHELNVDVSAGSLLKFYVSDVGQKVYSITCQVEVAWRKS